MTSDGRGSKAPHPRLTVLLLEDDDADAYLTRRALGTLPRVGQVVRAKNGEEAVELLQSGKVVPDIAFVDLQMPTMNGHDFLGACVDRGLANIPMVVLTSSSASNDALRSRVRGALRVITKPESPLDLRAALSEAIDAFTGPAQPLFAGRERQAMAVSGQEAVRDRPHAAVAVPPTPQFGRRDAGRRF